ncbi:GNAT family N-acetyltransferase [Marinimicrococcus flavescens]|uniref:GNAT family N-acetyltransferase n=1 Tax=Marinimicrococcus flavescens TaxID=3031815 RepID=A0AAP3UY11_9PROT|nr:GNAT family N-acetyltransferase [Marinimicrococcus flavescens]
MTRRHALTALERGLGLRTELTIRRARPVDAPALAQVQVDSWRETYAKLIPAPYLEGLSYTAHERQWRRTLERGGSAFLAVWGKQIVGLASGGACRSFSGFSGELHVLYVLRQFQRCGIGRALLDAIHYELARSGHGDMLIWVLAENPARGFYEKLGGRLVGEATCVVGGAHLHEVAYAWNG